MSRPVTGVQFTNFVNRFNTREDTVKSSLCQFMPAEMAQIIFAESIANIQAREAQRSVVDRRAHFAGIYYNHQEDTLSVCNIGCNAVYLRFFHKTLDWVAYVKLTNDFNSINPAMTQRAMAQGLQCQQGSRAYIGVIGKEECLKEPEIIGCKLSDVEKLEPLHEYELQDCIITSLGYNPERFAESPFIKLFLEIDLAAKSTGQIRFRVKSSDTDYLLKPLETKTYQDKNTQRICDYLTNYKLTRTFDPTMQEIDTRVIEDWFKGVRLHADNQVLDEEVERTDKYPDSHDELDAMVATSPKVRVNQKLVSEPRNMINLLRGVAGAQEEATIVKITFNDFKVGHRDNALFACLTTGGSYRGASFAVEVAQDVCANFTRPRTYPQVREGEAVSGSSQDSSRTTST